MREYIPLLFLIYSSSVFMLGILTGQISCSGFIDQFYETGLIIYTIVFAGLCLFFMIRYHKNITKQGRDERRQN